MITRRRCIVSVAAAAVCSAAAAVAQPLPAALQSCTHITRDSERLACFDREVAALSATTTAGASVSRPVAGAAASGPPAAATVAATGAVAAVAAPSAAGAAAAPGVAAPAVAAPAVAAPGVAAPAVAAPAVAAPGVAASRVAASAAAASAGATASAPNAAVSSLTPEQTFGLTAEGIRKLEAAQGNKSAQMQPPKALAAHIASVARNAAGRDVFTLDNGQVWRQSETRSTFEAHAGDAVVISSRALGSFWLSTSTHNGTRVERLR